MHTHPAGHHGVAFSLCLGLFSFAVTYPKLDYIIKEFTLTNSSGDCEV